METMTIDHELNLFPWMTHVLEQAKRYNVIAKGRRAGGTSLVEDVLLDLAAVGYPIGWFSATDKLLMETWDRYVDALAPLISRKQEQKRRLDLITGGIIECWSCESALTSRGRKYYAVAVDEAAHIPNLAETWECEILPCLLDLRGGAWFPSSPNGLGDFHTLWQRGQDPDFPDWASWQITTYENPNLDPADIDALRAVMSEQRFRQEILAQFVVMEGGVFPDFSRDANVKPVLLEDGLDTWLAVDEGYRTFAWLLAQIDKKENLRVVACDEWKNCSTEQARDRFRSMGWASRVQKVASDPAGNSRDIQTGISDLEVLRTAFPAAELRYSFDPRHRNPEWRASRIRDRILTASGTPRLFIHPQCGPLIRAIEGSAYPKLRPGSGEKQEPVKDGIHDHLRDALGYLEVNAFHSEHTVVSSKRPF